MKVKLLEYCVNGCQGTRENEPTGMRHEWRLKINYNTGVISGVSSDLVRFDAEPFKDCAQWPTRAELFAWADGFLAHAKMLGGNGGVILEG